VILKSRLHVTHSATLCTICTRLNFVEPQLSHNTDVKGIPSVDVEYLRNDTRQTQMLLQTTNSKWCGQLNCAVLMTLIKFWRPFNLGATNGFIVYISKNAASAYTSPAASMNFTVGKVFHGEKHLGHPSVVDTQKNDVICIIWIIGITSAIYSEMISSRKTFSVLRGVRSDDMWAIH